MTQSVSRALPARPLSGAPPGTVAVGLGAFALYSLAIGLFMAISPHAFYKLIGPFGVLNSHYVRDLATYNIALGVAMAASIGRVGWRVPVLALSTVQFGLHSLNHLLDIGRAHPVWTGYFDFFTLAASTLMLAWLWRVAATEARSR